MREHILYALYSRDANSCQAASRYDRDTAHGMPRTRNARARV